MPFNSNGYLETDKKEISVSDTWETQTEWEAYQSINGLEISNGVITLSESVLPDSVVHLYEYEDDSNTSIAIDSQGSNDMNLSGATYSNTSAVGNLALLHDGSDDTGVSQSRVNLASLGDTDSMSLSAFVNFQSLGSLSFNFSLWWGGDSNNFISLFDDGSNVGLYGQDDGNPFVNNTPFNPTLDQYYHIYIEWASDGNVILEIDGTEQINTNTSGDPITVGDGDLATGYSPGFNGNYSNVIVDDFAACNDSLTTTERETLRNR